MLPVHSGPWQTIYWWFRRLVRRLLFRTIHDVALMLDREAAKREVSPTAGVLDSHTVKALFADAAYERTNLMDKAAFLDVVVEIVRRSDPKGGFKVLPRRRVVERPFGWMVRWRRLVRDYERRLDVSEAMIHVAMGALLLRRVAHPRMSNSHSAPPSRGARTRDRCRGTARRGGGARRPRPTPRPIASRLGSAAHAQHAACGADGRNDRPYRRL